MTPDELRSLRDASPFRPFTLQLAGGKSLRVPHPDFLSVSPSGRLLIVYNADDTFSIVDLLLIAELAVEGQPNAAIEGAA